MNKFRHHVLCVRNFGRKYFTILSFLAVYIIYPTFAKIHAQADPCWPVGCSAEVEIEEDEDQLSDDDFDYDSDDNPVNQKVVEEDQKKKEKAKKDKESESTDEIKPAIAEKVIPYNRQPSRLALTGAYLSSLGAFQSSLPSGMLGILAYDQSPEFIFNRPSWFVPSLRLEPGYLLIGDSSRNVSGFVFQAGPLWQMPLGRSMRFRLELGFLAGAGVFQLKSGSYTAQDTTMIAAGLLGVSYNWNKISIFAHSRTSYIYDKIEPLMSVGGQAGVGYLF